MPKGGRGGGKKEDRTLSLQKRENGRHPNSKLCVVKEGSVRFQFGGMRGGAWYPPGAKIKKRDTCLSLLARKNVDQQRDREGKMTLVGGRGKQ